jgi:hypothetical protein
MNERWSDLQDDFGYTIGCLTPQEFLLMRYLTVTNPAPYAQVAAEPDGSYYCEVVSHHHLTASCWPIDEARLVAAGWEAPVGRQTNWYRYADSADQAAALLIEALRFGRACGDPERFVGTIDRWPPDDDGGREPVSPRNPFGLAA